MSHQSEQLIPCPFCGSAATIKKGKTIMVSCTGCTASTFQTLGDKTSAIVGWNTRAIASVKREPQWLPISSAPKEWGSYLVWHEKYGIETLWYQLKDGGLDGRLAGNWYSEDDMGDGYSRNYRVTHWMPLPPPPVTATTASREDA